MSVANPAVEACVTDTHLIGTVRRYEPPAGWRESLVATLMRGALRVGLKPFLGPPWPFAAVGGCPGGMNSSPTD